MRDFLFRGKNIDAYVWEYGDLFILIGNRWDAPEAVKAMNSEE